MFINTLNIKNILVKTIMTKIIYFIRILHIIIVHIFLYHFHWKETIFIFFKHNLKFTIDKREHITFK